MLQRKEIRTLSANELLALRQAMIIFQNRSATDKHSYIYLATYHGISKWLCEHGLLFLPWHRMYIWKFENELQQIDPNISLPYWNWANEAYFNACVASAHNDSTFVLNKITLDNPLYAGPKNSLTVKTSRNINFDSASLTSILSSLNYAYQRNNYLNFNNAVIGPHRSIHIRVGNDMATMDYAAFDPIFWSHHAAVDRQWAIWQRTHTSPDPTIPLDSELKGLDGKKVKDVLDYENQLGYQYDNLNTGILRFTDEFKNTKSFTIIKVSGIGMEIGSYAVDVFLKNNQTGQEVYAGFFGIFGMHQMMHMPGMGHHQKSDSYIDITAALKTLKTDKNNVTIKLQAIDTKGNTVDPNKLPLEGISFI